MKKNRNLLHEVTVWLLIQFAAVILVNGVCILYSRSMDYIAHTKWLIKTVLPEVKEEITEYEPLPWLVNYWLNRHKEMELSEDRTALEEKISDILQKYKMDSIKEVKQFQLEGFTEEEQRLYAEACYLAILDSIKDYTDQFDLLDITCVNISDDGTLTSIFQGRESSHDNLYSLGEKWPIDIEMHPAVNEMYEKKEDKVTMEEAISSEDHHKYLYAYIPIVSEGKILCLVSASASLWDLAVNLLKHAAAVELINALLLIACAACMLYMIYKKVIKPVLCITGCVEEYTHTRSSGKIVNRLMGIKSRNELKKLADDISDMIISMEQYSLSQQRQAAEEQRIKTELSLAEKIQVGALPMDFSIFSGRSDIDLYASMTPAKIVGGDFYDFFFIDHDHLYISIADVSGKGIPAAMFMMSCMSILSNYVSKGRSPAEILEAANRAVFKSNGEKMFVTVWVGILELTTGRLTCANAGHERPAVMQPDGDFYLVKDKHGLVLGSFEGLTYDEYVIELKPGAKLFVFTDGVVEASDKNEELYGKERMLSALNSAKTLPPSQIINKVRRSIDSFVQDEKQFDDITMLCLEYKPKRE